jgi:hypothetical protein
MGGAKPRGQTAPGWLGHQARAAADVAALKSFQSPVPKDKEIYLHVDAISTLA